MILDLLLSSALSDELKKLALKIIILLNENPSQ
jgi:hypothetical protein